MDGGFWDPFSNRYDFVYDTNGLLVEVRGPNTNHFFRLEYERVTNSVDAGWVEFTLTDSGASEVLIPASWNNWHGVETPMALSDGVWRAQVWLEPGFYEYKFLVRYAGDTNDYWMSDPDNSIQVGPDSNSVAVVDPYRLIKRVTASDGRSVSYEYDWAYNLSHVLDIRLRRAIYGDGATAEYTYYPASYDQDREMLLATADDPMIPGPARAVAYHYHTNRSFSGMIYEERALVSSQLLG